MTKSEIVEAVQEALGNHPCRYGIAPGDVMHVGGMLKDIGDGDLARGVEIVRINHKWVQKRVEDLDEEYRANHAFITSLRHGMGTISNAIAKGLVAILLAALLAMIWIGFKIKVSQ